MYPSLRVRHRHAFTHSSGILLSNLTKPPQSERDGPPIKTCPWHLPFKLPLRLRWVPLLTVYLLLLQYLPFRCSQEVPSTILLCLQSLNINLLVYPLTVYLRLLLQYLHLHRSRAVPFMIPLYLQFPIHLRLLNSPNYRWFCRRRNNSHVISALKSLHVQCHPTPRNTNSPTARDSSSSPSSSRLSTTKSFVWVVRLGDTQLFHCTS